MTWTDAKHQRARYLLSLIHPGEFSSLFAGALQQIEEGFGAAVQAGKDAIAEAKVKQDAQFAQIEVKLAETRQESEDTARLQRFSDLMTVHYLLTELSRQIPAAMAGTISPQQWLRLEQWANFLLRRYVEGKTSGE